MCCLAALNANNWAQWCYRQSLMVMMMVTMIIWWRCRHYFVRNACSALLASNDANYCHRILASRNAKKRSAKLVLFRLPVSDSRETVDSVFILSNRLYCTFNGSCLVAHFDRNMLHDEQYNAMGRTLVILVISKALGQQKMI